MIFSNEGYTQIGGTPVDNTLELTGIIRTMRKRYISPDGECFADKVLVLAGRLSQLTEEEEQRFHATLAGQELKIDDVLEKLESYMVKIGKGAV